MASRFPGGVTARTAEEPAAPPAPRPGPGALDIKVRGLRKGYGGRVVLDALDLAIPAGAFVAIVGRSGCGKSTLLRLLAGLETQEFGELEIGHVAARDRRDGVRLMFQDARLLPWKSVIDNVLIGLGRDARPRADALLAKVGLRDRINDWPRVLSGGQRQRVALARALIRAPGLLLLDEPLGALDALTRMEMQDLIETLWRQQGFTAVLVTHDVAEAVRLADRVILLEEGRVALDLTINLPRPRPHASAELARIEARILDRLLEG